MKENNVKMGIRFVVTTSCNANCYFCLNEYLGSKSPKIGMTSENYQTISECAKRIGIQNCTITGGEPTLRKDLEEIVEKIKSVGLNITVVSNGYLLKDHLDAFGFVDELHVSYHSFDDKEWEKITRVKNGPLTVRENLKAVRKCHPKLPIRLNVVADEKNSKTSNIKKYIQLAKEINAEISVFQNGYLRLLKEAGKLTECEEPHDFWDLDKFGGKLIKKTVRKRVYDVEGVKINLSYLSSEKCSGSSFWITPMAEGFADIRKRNSLIHFAPMLKEKNTHMIEDSLNSLSKEAKMLKELEIKGIPIKDSSKYQKLITKRKSDLITIENPYSW